MESIKSQSNKTFLAFFDEYLDAYKETKSEKIEDCMSSIMEILKKYANLPKKFKIDEPENEQKVFLKDLETASEQMKNIKDEFFKKDQMVRDNLQQPRKYFRDYLKQRNFSPSTIIGIRQKIDDLLYFLNSSNKLLNKREKKLELIALDFEENVNERELEINNEEIIDKVYAYLIFHKIKKAEIQIIGINDLNLLIQMLYLKNTYYFQFTIDSEEERTVIEAKLKQFDDKFEKNLLEVANGLESTLFHKESELLDQINFNVSLKKSAETMMKKLKSGDNFKSRFLNSFEKEIKSKNLYEIYQNSTYKNKNKIIDIIVQLFRKVWDYCRGTHFSREAAKTEFKEEYKQISEKAYGEAREKPPLSRPRN